MNAYRPSSRHGTVSSVAGRNSFYRVPLCGCDNGEYNIEEQNDGRDCDGRDDSAAPPGVGGPPGIFSWGRCFGFIVGLFDGVTSGEGFIFQIPKLVGIRMGMLV